jgi:hypothetical protein
MKFFIFNFCAVQSYSAGAAALVETPFPPSASVGPQTKVTNWLLLVWVLPTLHFLLRIAEHHQKAPETMKKPWENGYFHLFPLISPNIRFFIIFPVFSSFLSARPPTGPPALGRCHGVGTPGGAALLPHRHFNSTLKGITS